MIENGKVYEVFNGNAIEVEIFFDYLREAEISPNMIYLDVGFAVLKHRIQLSFPLATDHRPHSCHTRRL
jgi:hypothetical protein